MFETLDITSLKKNGRSRLYNAFDVVIINCDGVVWTLLDAIPNAGRTVMSFKRAGKLLKLYTNYCFANDMECIRKLNNIGISGINAVSLKIFEILKENFYVWFSFNRLMFCIP